MMTMPMNTNGFDLVTDTPHTTGKERIMVIIIISCLYELAYEHTGIGFHTINEKNYFPIVGICPYDYIHA